MIKNGAPFAKEVYNVGEDAEIKCLDGFVLVGSATTKCLPIKKFVPIVAVCSPGEIVHVFLL